MPKIRLLENLAGPRHGRRLYLFGMRAYLYGEASEKMKRNDLIKKFPREIIPQSVDIELLAYRGSIVHGMYIPNSDPDSIDDVDLLGIIIPRWENYFAIEGKDEWGKRGTKNIFYNEFDCTYYEILKFVNLLLKGNPNVIGILWLNEKYYITKGKLTDDLIENRNFLEATGFVNHFPATLTVN